MYVIALSDMNRIFMHCTFYATQVCLHTEKIRSRLDQWICVVSVVGLSFGE